MVAWHGAPHSVFEKIRWKSKIKCAFDGLLTFSSTVENTFLTRINEV